MSGQKAVDPIKQKKLLRASMEEAQKSYNKNLVSLTKVASAKSPGDELIAKINETLRGVLAIDETLIIVETGPYVWKYREPISKKDVKFFIDNDFKSDVDGALAGKSGKTGKSGKSDFSSSEIANVMSSLKKTFQTMSAAEQQVVWTYTTTLLISYTQYLKAERDIKKIEEELRSFTS